MHLNPMGSYWGAPTAIDEAAEDDLTGYARSLLDAHGPGWEWGRHSLWVQLMPAGVQMRPQGWKLHISATSGSAREVLGAVIPLLLRERAPFKFAATRDRVRGLNTPYTPRGSAGKFITIYPVDDAQAICLADACDRATRGLAGPAILSDRSLRPGSLVHYRYGAFRGDGVFDDDGGFVGVIRDPNGNPVP
ncbi:MAG: class IV lanthionine synthetase LanL, partial [Actinomycetota bacterium]